MEEGPGLDSIFLRQKSLQNKDIYATVSSMLSKKKKANAIAGTRIHDKDTGSPEVQISLLSKQIDELASHLKKHPKDKHSRRGLLQMVANRRTHLGYLKKKNEKRYASVVKKLELSK